ncbi:MAG: B12-binding domain-containing radical SAM protein [Proteobacteria bacterium]|nr:B12-binding domain-containing radical SAM protein [Pseudomonadota bacterium]
MKLINPDILLINPNQLRPPVAPLALEYLGASLGKKGYRVLLWDFCRNPRLGFNLKQNLEKVRPGLIGITFRNLDDAYLFSGREFLSGLKNLVKEIKKSNGAPVVIGGTGFSLAPREILRVTGADFGIWGEGEASLPQLLAKLEVQSLRFKVQSSKNTSEIPQSAFLNPQSLSDVPGLVWREGKEIRQNPPGYIEDLDDLGLENRGFIDNRFYFLRGGMGGFESKRGCDRSCVFCADPVTKGRRLRLRSPESVAEEVRKLLTLGVTHFHTCDSEFNHPREHAEAVCREFIRRGLGRKIRWYAYCTPAGFDREFARVMKAAGCRGINFGTDHTEDSMLRKLGRDYGFTEIERARESCRKEGIVVMLDLLLGGPGETRNTLSELIKKIKKLDPERVGLSLGVRVYPGTALAKKVVAEGELSKNVNLHGRRANNNSFRQPVFFLSEKLGRNPLNFLQELVGGDRRFFLPSGDEAEKDYNYDDNDFISRAILKEGYRGAFWEILRRKAEGIKPD